MKTITLICGGESTCRSLKEQLNSYMGQMVRISSVPMDLWLPDQIESDLLVFSSKSVEVEFLQKVAVAENQKIITVERTLNAKNIGKLVNIEENEKILFVNDHTESAQRCIDILREIGFIHLNIIPCAPPQLETAGRTLAITAGEAQLIPGGVKMVCDLGSRIMDFPSILKIASILGVENNGFKNPDYQYLKEIVRSGSKVKTLNSRILKMMEGISEGMLSYDFNGKILVANEKVKRILMENRRLQGKKIQNLITDEGLTDFLLSRKSDHERLINLHSREVFLTKIVHKNSHTIVCRFKVLSEIEEDNLKVKELRKKGYYGKYTFHDIIGKSTSIQRACQTGKKLAASSLTILLEGESGTGKELMASAIHNSSSRKDEPYLAINLNAINESLLESELFGYEPGAFTGASREGKPGLFEQADGGTLFLDEIGDISPNIQKGLLRVLQDGEVMRIGGKRIRRTDVRIIAATNKNLANLAQNGDFRNDLLYRIRQGYIQMPALRERKGDIPILTQHLISREGYSDVKIESDLYKRFNSYNWPGNIRELKNIILCLLAIKENNVLQYCDIPPGMFEQSLSQSSLSLRENILLETVESLSHEGLLVTREKVFQDCRKKSYPFTLSQVRKGLEDLLSQGYLSRKKDRYGIYLSEKGNNALRNL